MKPYGQFCPLAQATQLLCERWTLIIVRELMAGSTRFGELQKGAPLLSPTLLSLRLKQLVKAGVVEQDKGAAGPTYRLTPLYAFTAFIVLIGLQELAQPDPPLSS